MKDFMPRRIKGYQAHNKESFAEGMTISFNGDLYNVLDLDPDFITKDKIATSLSRQARYYGHTDHPYYTAQHCVMGAEAFLAVGLLQQAKQFLYHDAGEAFMGDISAPLKRELKKMTGGRLDEIEAGIEAKIAEKFGFKFPYDPVIKTVDLNLAQIEMTIHMGNQDKIDEDYYWDSKKAKKRWLQMADQIDMMIGYNKESGKGVVTGNTEIGDPDRIVLHIHVDTSGTETIIENKHITIKGIENHAGWMKLNDKVEWDDIYLWFTNNVRLEGESFEIVKQQ